MVHIRDFPLVWPKITDLLLAKKLQEGPQRRNESFPNVLVAGVCLSLGPQPVKVQATVLDLDHPIARLILDLETAGRVLGQLDVKAPHPSRGWFKPLELRLQRRGIGDRRPLAAGERLPECSQMAVLEAGQAFKLNAQHGFNHRRGLVIRQRA